MCAPQMVMVDVLCPKCFVPMLTVRSGTYLACGSCQKVWMLVRTPHKIDWAKGDIRKSTPRAPAPIDIESAFAAAMEGGLDG